LGLAEDAEDLGNLLSRLLDDAKQRDKATEKWSDLMAMLEALDAEKRAIIENGLQISNPNREQRAELNFLSNKWPGRLYARQTLGNPSTPKGQQRGKRCCRPH